MVVISRLKGAKGGAGCRGKEVGPDDFASFGYSLCVCHSPCELGAKAGRRALKQPLSGRLGNDLWAPSAQKGLDLGGKRGEDRPTASAPKKEHKRGNGPKTGLNSPDPPSLPFCQILYLHWASILVLCYRYFDYILIF